MSILLRTTSLYCFNVSVHAILSQPTTVMYFSGTETPLKVPLPVQDVDPLLTRGSLGQSESSPKQHLDRFERFCSAHRSVLHFTMGRHMTCTYTWQYLIHGFEDQPESPHAPNSISIGSAIFAGLTNVSNRQTDRPTTLLRA